MTVDVDQDRLVDALSSALRYGGSALGDVPGLLKRVLVEGVWRDFTTRRRKPVHHDRFAEFVTATPPDGLGSDLALVKRIVAGTEVEDLLDQELRNPKGRPRKDANSNHSKVTGTTRSAALRRLRDQRPDLHAEVLAGRLTANAAAIQAGFRKRTFTVRLDSPESIANSLRRQLDPEVLAKLVQLLGGA